MRFAAAVLAYAAFRLLVANKARRDGYSSGMPVGSTLLGLWAAYELVA
jgi:hypothetical protein